MTKEEALSFYQQYRDKCNAYQLAETTIFYDMSTIAPTKGNDYRIKMMALLSSELFDYQIHPDNIHKLEEMATMDLGEIMNKEIKLVLKDINRIAKLPRDFYIKMQEVTNKGEQAWKLAKENNDYSLFKDTLKELIQIKKQAYTYYGIHTTIYDAMLDDYEKGMNIQKYDEFFLCIKTRLIPFIKTLVEKGKYIDDAPLYQYYPIEGQEKVMEILKDYMGFDDEECYMSISAHPFTCDFSLHDVRITNKYLEDSLMSSIFSIIHEYGHALYMLHVDPKLEGLLVGRNMSSGMHESQSRFLENYIGRRSSFWVNHYPKIQDIFPDQLKDIHFNDFMKMMNVAKPSLIRTEADELTYPLHILIRYELEKEMINGQFDIDHLDDIWADKYEAYLGIRPQNVNEGILQDIHWSDGSFGYFPTYALGSAFAAQFFDAMKQEIDVDEALVHKNFSKIENWLTEHIHQYGAFYDADEMIQKVCHQTFDPNIYIDYLIEKYSKLYHLDETNIC